MRKEETPVIQAQELRIGNNLLRLVASIQKDVAPYLASVKVDATDIVVCARDQEGFNMFFKPMPLTEAVMKKIRKIYNRNKARGLLHRIPMGERQVNNQYWSGDLHDGFCRLHMCPEYHNNLLRSQMAAEDRDQVAPEFWYIWLTASGTGSSWFMSAVGIHDPSRVRYVHELQNLFFWLERKELILR